MGILAVVAMLATRSRTPTQDSGLDAVQTFEVAQDHVTTPVTYPQTPPAGGEHAPVWLTCGIYDEPVPNENAVHALEHGAVWVTYRPGLSAENVQLLREKMPDTYAVLSPFPGLPAPVVASAWGKQLALTGPQDPRLANFIRSYRQGPQSPEPGATCEGGVGEPIGPA